MDFKERFLGKSTTFTKNGFNTLLSCPGSPIDKTEWQQHLAKLNQTETLQEEKRLKREIIELNGLQDKLGLPKLSSFT